VADFVSAAHNGAQVSAIGALERGVLAWLNWETKTYEPIPVEEQCEVVSILGDVAKSECGAPSLHLHGVLGFRGGATVGGHVRELHVRPTLEVIVTETSEHLRRRPRPDLGGIALIDLKDGA
jgi:predicted DNA-binding protein with PD1-like motif